MRGGAVVRPPLPWFLDGMTRPGRSSTFDRLIPSLFVVIWATGFVVARQAVPHADPFTFLWVRFFLAAAILAAAASLVLGLFTIRHFTPSFQAPAADASEAAVEQPVEGTAVSQR